MNIIQALDDPKVFGDFFRAGTWDAWRAFLCALFGLPMTDDQLETYRLRLAGMMMSPTRSRASPQSTTNTPATITVFAAGPTTLTTPTVPALGARCGSRSI